MGPVTRLLNDSCCKQALTREREKIADVSMVVPLLVVALLATVCVITALRGSLKRLEARELKVMWMLQEAHAFGVLPNA